MSERVLITGGAGLLGRTLLALAPPDLSPHATWRTTPLAGARGHRVALDVAEQVDDLWAELRPTLVIHTAATMGEGERDIWRATRHVVAACARHDTALIHMSTDALFDGEHAPYRESDEPAPVHEYGRWKARAEHHVRETLPTAAVVRTSLICQWQPLDPRSRWVADALREGRPITLFSDELRCPIHVEDLARQLWALAALPTADRAGLWHLVGPEALSRYAIGLLIAAHEGLEPAGITRAPSAHHPVPRPRDLRLLTLRADRSPLPAARPISATL